MRVTLNTAFSSLRLKAHTFPGLSAVLPKETKERPAFFRKLSAFLADADANFPETILSEGRIKSWPAEELLQTTKPFEPTWKRVQGLDPEDFYEAENRLLIVGDTVFLLSLSTDREKPLSETRPYESNRFIVTHMGQDENRVKVASREGSPRLEKLTDDLVNRRMALLNAILPIEKLNASVENLNTRLRRIWSQEGMRLLQGLPNETLHYFSEKGFNLDGLYKIIDQAIKKKKVRLGTPPLETLKPRGQDSVISELVMAGL